MHYFTLLLKFVSYLFARIVPIISFYFFWKDVYPYEYLDDWEKFSETSLHEKEHFYSYLNMENIIDTDYTHAKKICKDFEVKNLE